MQLTRIERLILANQCKILGKLYPEDVAHYRKNQKILEEGFAQHYDDCCQHIWNEFPEKASLEVIDILQVHSDLLVSWQELKDKGGIEEQNIRFRGFDGNNEAEYLNYADFFLNDLKRFNELPHKNLNSHMPTLQRYRAMVQEARKHERPYDAAQIKAISNAK